jgi:phage shock protein A
MNGLSDRSAFEAFDRMAQRIEDNERRALAAAEVAEDLSRRPAGARVRQLESGGECQRGPAAAGAEAEDGVLPPAPAAETRRLSEGGAASDAAKGSGGAGAAGGDDEADAINDAELLEAEFEELERGEQGRTGGGA